MLSEKMWKKSCLGIKKQIDYREFCSEMKILRLFIFSVSVYVVNSMCFYLDFQLQVGTYRVSEIFCLASMKISTGNLLLHSTCRDTPSRITMLSAKYSELNILRSWAHNFVSARLVCRAKPTLNYSYGLYAKQ